MGRNVSRKVGMNSDNVSSLNPAGVRATDSKHSAAPDPAPPSADHQGRHAEPFDARVPPIEESTTGPCPVRFDRG